MGELFDALCPQSETSLSCKRINLDTVPQATILVLAPLFAELNQLDESLDQDEFVSSCQNLLKSLNVTQRAQLLKPLKSDRCTAPPILPFRPEINPRSRELHADLLETVPVVERLLIRGRIRQDKLVRLQKMHES